MHKQYKKQTDIHTIHRDEDKIQNEIVWQNIEHITLKFYGKIVPVRKFMKTSLNLK